MAQAKASTTMVRSAMARFESTCATPTLASRAVAAAKTAESIAHPIQLMEDMVRARPPAVGGLAVQAGGACAPWGSWFPTLRKIREGWGTHKSNRRFFDSAALRSE